MPLLVILMPSNANLRCRALRQRHLQPWCVPGVIQLREQCLCVRQQARRDFLPRAERERDLQGWEVHPR